MTKLEEYLKRYQYYVGAYESTFMSAKTEVLRLASKMDRIKEWSERTKSNWRAAIYMKEAMVDRYRA